MRAQAPHAFLWRNAMMQFLFVRGLVQWSWQKCCLCMAIVAFFLPLVFGQTAWALITGGEGNAPINDPGWPKGAAVIFNTQSRVAWWEGPPFGGGQWHAECKGDASDLNVVLADFAKVDVAKKRIVVHNGFGNSFWLNPNREKDKKDKALIDWTFTVWQQENRPKVQGRLPARVRLAMENEDRALAQFDVYTGGF